MSTTSVPNPKVKAHIYYCRFLEPGLVKYENQTILIDAKNLDRIAKRHIGVPILIDHPQADVTEDTIDSMITVGNVCETFVNNNGFVIEVEEDGEFKFKEYEPDHWAWAKCIIYDQRGVDLIEGEGWGVSNAYTPTKQNKGGIYHSSYPYDSEIVDVDAEHIALVKSPRYENVKIFKNSLDNQNSAIITDLGNGYSYKSTAVNVSDLKTMANPKNFLGSVKKAATKLFNSSETDKVANEVEEMNEDFFIVEGKKIPKSVVANKVANALKNQEAKQEKVKEGLTVCKEVYNELPFDENKKYKIGDVIMNGKELFEYYKNAPEDDMMEEQEQEKEMEVEEESKPEMESQEIEATEDNEPKADDVYELLAKEVLDGIKEKIDEAEEKVEQLQDMEKVEKEIENKSKMTNKLQNSVDLVKVKNQTILSKPQEAVVFKTSFERGKGY